MKTRAIAIALTVIQVLLFALHYAVYKSFVEFFGVVGYGELLATRIVFFVLSLSFILMSIAASKHYGWLVRTLYTASAIWIGTLYCLLASTVIAWLAYAVALLASPYANPAPAGIVLFVLALLLSAYGVWNSYNTKVRNVSVKLANLPEQWVGRRAVLVADTHFGAVRTTANAKKVASLVSSLEPDIVFFSGDFYDGTPMDYAAVAQPFSAIKSKFGTFFAAGNHEEYGNTKAYLAALGGAGMKVLVDEAKNVDGINVIGINYADTSKPEDEARILQGLNLDRSAVNILMKHEPKNIAVAEQAGVSLQLSGHTHLGQMWPLGYVAYALYKKYYYGLHTLNGTQVYTTSGVGTWGPPQRIGTSSEVVVVTFA